MPSLYKPCLCTQDTPTSLGPNALWIVRDRCTQIMHRNLCLSEAKLFPGLQSPLRWKHPSSRVPGGRDQALQPWNPSRLLSRCFLPLQLVLSPLWASAHPFEVAQDLFTFWVLVAGASCPCPLLFCRWQPSALKLDQMEAFQRESPEGGTQLGRPLELEERPASEPTVN